MNVKIKIIENGKLPEYKTAGAAGADCFARIEKDEVIKPGEKITIPLGFAVEIPEGYEMQVRGRSGLARKNGIDCFLGTIDSDYRGEIAAILFNKGHEDFTVHNGDRIAQMVISPVVHACWDLNEELSETERGEGGFGSTGISELKMGYPHEIEKFYEPFTKIEEVEQYFGHKVKIDSYFDGVVVGCKKDPAFSWFYVLIELNENQKMNDSSLVQMSLSKAFERITIDGHRFGKEIDFEE